MKHILLILSILMVGCIIEPRPEKELPPILENVDIVERGAK